MNSNTHRCISDRAVQMVVVAIALMCGATAEGAPIAFTFQATVTSLNGDFGALNLPFTLTTGQQISGTYTFASESDLIDIMLHPDYGVLHPELAKSGTLALNLGGTSLSGSVNTTGGMLFDPPISEPGPFSMLSLGYFGPTNLSHAGFIAGQGWDHQFTAVGPDGILANPTTDPAHFFDLAAWNQLTIRRGLILIFGNFFNVVVVGTTVGNFSAVPEPAAVWLLYSLFVLAPFLFFRRVSCTIRHCLSPRRWLPWCWG